MKYIVVDEKRNGFGDEFTREFDDRNDAIEEAKNQWYYLTKSEKKVRKVYVIESVNPDEDAMDHMDGNFIWHSDYGEWLCYGEDGFPTDHDVVYWQCDHCLETQVGRREKPMTQCPACGIKMLIK